MKEMIAYCGINCTECPGQVATRENDLAKAKVVAEQTSAYFKREVSVEDVWCDGCLTAGKKCRYCSECKIRACGIEKGVENCAHCGQYGCETLVALFAIAPAAKAILDGIRNRL